MALATVRKMRRSHDAVDAGPFRLLFSFQSKSFSDAQSFLLVLLLRVSLLGQAESHGDCSLPVLETSSSDLHRPPSAADLKPNAHPYPIATTATALLSRANSLSSPSPNQTRHHYVPPSPSASGEFRDGRDGDREKGADKMDKETREKSERRRAEYRGHRYSRSLSSSEDMYLPSASPSASAKGKDKTANGEYSGAPRARARCPSRLGCVHLSRPLPPLLMKTKTQLRRLRHLPKRWTPAQLAAHLAHTVSAEAGAWAAQKNVGGRAFIRMGMDGMGEGEGELDGDGVSAGVCYDVDALFVFFGGVHMRIFFRSSSVILCLCGPLRPVPSTPSSILPIILPPTVRDPPFIYPPTSFPRSPLSIIPSSRSLIPTTLPCPPRPSPSP
ncbi:hypothetical protein B0H13DRAFT_2348399 [Mycena leptocephala]|nr:hypothetical protein B0H13DRAFT_2348399 [Mycena leptocephala]